MTAVVVFSGPTVPPATVATLLPEALCLGPAARGDVYRAALDGPRAICLIDGYFEHRPSVTHKEILWALARGIPVFGAASMGALRAAELHELGMAGSGAIFADFVGGRLEDDDEVAVVHASAEHGYRAGSEAMVNLRATVTAAIGAEVISSSLGEAFLARAKALFYPERDYARVLQELRLDHDPSAISTFEAWLAIPEHRVDQKRDDAVALLNRVAASLREGRLESPKVSWVLPETTVFGDLKAEFEQLPSSFDNAVTEEVQLLGPEIYSEIMSSAALRAIALLLDSEAPAGDPAPRSARTSGAFEEQEQRVRLQMPRVHALVIGQVDPVLRALGDYERVAARATKKRELCRALTPARAAEAAEDVEEYFCSVLRRPLPDDLSRFARSVGFSSVASFKAAVHREMTFLRLLSSAETD